MMTSTMKAIISLRPKAQWTLRGGEELEWNDTEQTQPSKAEIAAEVIRLEAEYDRLAYSRTRASEYPPIGDQLDALWKGGDDAAAMKVIVDKVKSDNPKG